ncbi:class I SAM-dependent methyltransferase [Naasia aerilata]|uniref:Methyltransferase domain-containing protein n=1 Tax=Naasia aerilata TaxID=1162966 RepID=A0ABM8G7S4_9MICO|nr:class I SAM-dependent methyltransferase [Naasia aerilata]BDZ44146.1 hypothetical protein GCM10025866_00550 [Naasia aerilata]
MFTSSPEYYDLAYDSIDYPGQAAALRGLIAREAPEARTLLDVACGSGRHLEQLRDVFEVEGLDVNPGLLALAAARCPGVPFHEARMEDFDLLRRFDVITCLFSSIAYVETEEGLRSAVAAMARHLNPGGLLVIEPWFEPEAYRVDTITANHSGSGATRVCWMYTSKREGAVSILDAHGMVGTPERIQHFSEVHRLGLFTRQQHQGAFEAAGLTADLDPVGPFGRGRGLYLAREA